MITSECSFDIPRVNEFEISRQNKNFYESFILREFSMLGATGKTIKIEEDEENERSLIASRIFET